MALAQYAMNWASNLCGATTNFFHSTTFPFPPPTLIVIEDVKIWDGEQYLNDTSITIQGQTIISIGGTGTPKGAKNVQGNGGFLMPGLIDAHVHVATLLSPSEFENDSYLHLKELVESGITTAFDMGSFPSSAMSQFKDLGTKGLTSLLWSGAAACVGKPGFPADLPDYPYDAIVTSNESATNYAETRIKEGADYFKIFIDDNGKPDQQYQEIIKSMGDQSNKLLVSHAPGFLAQEIARNVGGRFITHVPKEKALNETGVNQMLANKQVAIPTLIMLQSLIDIGPIVRPGNAWNYTYSHDSVALMYKMGVPILVGTDASQPVGIVGYGASIHTEFGLLHDAGMTPTDILRGATSLPAKYFNLTDRGRIAVGLRADLVLLKEDPVVDITNSNTIQQVWTAGTSAYQEPT